MAVDGPVVLESQRGEHVGEEGLLEAAADAVEHLLHRLAEGDLLQEAMEFLLELRVEGGAAQLVEIGRDRPHGRGDREAVVVEDHQDPPAGGADVVERLEGDAAGERAVPDDADDLALPAQVLVGDRAAERGGQPGPDVAEVEGVGLALGLPGETREAAELADRVESVLAARQDLVGVGLVAAVPDDQVLEDVEDVVQGEGQVDHAEVAPEVPPALEDDVEDDPANLLRQGGEVLRRDLLDVVGTGDSIEESAHVRFSSFGRGRIRRSAGVAPPSFP